MASNVELSTTTADAPRGDALALWEIASVVLSGLIAEWVVLVFIGNSKFITAIPIVLALGLMWFSHRERNEGLKDLGFRADNFVASGLLLLWPTLFVVAAVIFISWLTNQQLLGPWRWRFAALPLWALFQQYVLNGYINRRAQMALGKGAGSVLLVAVCFSVLHLPNPMLAATTLIAGCIWAFVYQRVPNLYALALSHTITSIALALTISPRWLNSLRVGFKYFG